MKKRYSFLSKTWLCFGLAAAASAAFSFNLQAQTAPTKQWDKTFGGTSADILRTMQQTADGGYILGGYSTSGASADKTQAPKGGTDFWVVKLNPLGVKVWDKTFGGTGEDRLISLHQTADGGYILGGQSSSGISGDKSQAGLGDMDYWMVKIDANGAKVWDKTFGGSALDNLYHIKQTADGGYILGGLSSSGISADKSQASVGGGDFWIVKTDAAGNKVWEKTIIGNDFELFRTLELTSDGGCLVGGQSRSGIGGHKTEASRGGLDYWVVKLDATGNKTWDKTFGGSGLEDLLSIDQTSDGGYILGGFSDSNTGTDKSQASNGSSDYWIIRLNAAGNKLWDKTFGGNDFDELFKVQQTTDGGFILGGHSASGISGDKTDSNLGFSDFWLLKLNAAGNKLWDKTYGGDDETFITLQQTTDEGYVLAGISPSGIGGDKTEASRGGNDYWILKTGKEILGTPEAEPDHQIAVSPNPSNGKFNLHLRNLPFKAAEITVTDLLGRTVLQKNLQVTNNQLSEELSLPNAKGIYLLQLKAGEQTFTCKIVVE